MRNLGSCPEDKGEIPAAFGKTREKLCDRMLSVEVDYTGLEN